MIKNVIKKKDILIYIKIPILSCVTQKIMVTKTNLILN